jgi:ATP-dependent RNA helicase DHX57
MPVDPRIGKMLVFGAMLGCLNSILTIAGAMQGRGLFMTPREDADRQKATAARIALAKGSKSDHLTSVAAFNAWCVDSSSRLLGWAWRMSLPLWLPVQHTLA